MALFAIAVALFLMSGEASGSIEDHCTDISYYDVIKYETSTKQCCDTKLHQVCTTKSDQVCQDVLELQCDVVAWGECISTPTNTPGTKCSVKFNDFDHQNCEEVITSVAHTKKMAECKEVTKNNCVTDWEVDDNGNKVWAGTETCTPVTWEECELVEKTVEFPTVKTVCDVDSHIKWAEFIDATTNIVGLESKCEVKKAVHCKKVLVNKCAPVVWEECKMEPKEECFAKVVHTPSQEKSHKKKCLTEGPPGEISSLDISVWVDGRKTTSPLSLGSRATVTCQSTGGHPEQSLTLYKNQERLGSQQQNQISHNFTVDQDDHEAVFQCEAQDQTRSDPPHVVEVAVKVYLPCSAWTWNEWSDCSKTCGRGNRTRNRTSDKNGIFAGCKVELNQMQWCPSPNVYCPTEPCSEWQWTDWTTCSVNCGNGVQTRQRKVDVDTFRIFRECEEERIELKGCTEDCPIRCNGTIDCCKPSNPCGLGDGHCDEDNDCIHGLVCGDPEDPEDNRCRQPKGFCSGGVCIPNLPNEETRDSAVKLESNIIPYFFTDPTTEKDKVLYRDVMKKIEKETKFFFQEEKVLAKCEIMRCLEIETKSETKTNCNCRGHVSYLPKKWAERVLFISKTQVNDQEECKTQCQGFIHHELMHVLGMNHTFTRHDRDDYIEVILDNVDLRLQNLFTICGKEVCPLDDDFKYDCDSIMHYGTHSSDGVKWMEPIDETCKGKLQEKQKTKPSKDDLRLLKKISVESWSAEIAANRRCTEGRDASVNTTTYNWYDDKWPAKNHTAESCKALCHQDPTCPQADFYDLGDDRGDCYVYTTSTEPGVNVGGCAVVGCVPKEMYFKCEEEQGIIKSVRALGGLMQHMSFELFKIVDGSTELTENEKSLIDEMKKTANYFKSCHTQNRCNSKEISGFAMNLHSKYALIYKISHNFSTSFIEEKNNLHTSIFTSLHFLKPYKACTTTCGEDEECVEDRCLKKCQVTDLENLDTTGYDWIQLDDCYCAANGGSVCPHGGKCGGNMCEINHGCMTDVCPNAEGLITPPNPTDEMLYPWELFLG